MVIVNDHYHSIVISVSNRGVQRISGQSSLICEAVKIWEWKDKRAYHLTLYGSSSHYQQTVNYLEVLVTTKGVDLTGLLEEHKRRLGFGDRSPPAGSKGRAPVGCLGDEDPRSWSFLWYYTIFALKYNKQLLLLSTFLRELDILLVLTRDDIVNDITSKILGGHYHGRPT